MPHLSESQFMRLIPLQRLAALGRWRVEAMRSLPEACLLYVTKGMGRITVAGLTRGYSAGNTIFIPAGVMHGFELGPNVQGIAVFLGSDCTLNVPNSPQHFRLRDANAQNELANILDMIQRENDTKRPAFARAVHYHLGLISVWLERQVLRAEPDTIPPDAAQRLVARFTEVMELRFRKGIGVAELAEELGVTPTHLTRCCRGASGRTALEMLQDRRLFEARKLLSDTKLPVGQIGMTLGFASAAYFTRAFQNQTGLSPSAFRRTG
jgi:AraC family transcriptional regulator, transcriptional activator of pobA